MSLEASVIEKRPTSRFLIPSLVVASFTIGISNAIVALLSVDMAFTFFNSANAAAIARVGQLSTFNALSEVISAIILSILAIRFRHKPLLLIGLLFVGFSAVGSFFAPSLPALQLFYALEGFGTIFVSVMVFAIIGDLLPPDKKAKAISYMISAGATATLLLALLLGFIADIGGWRYGFLLLTMPFSLASIAIVTLFAPRQHLISEGNEKNSLLKSLKIVLSNRSAAACLAASILTVAGTQVGVFAIAFYRTSFGASRNLTVLIYEIAVILFVIVPLFTGPLINKVGAKRLTIISTSLAAIFTMAFFFIPILWLSVTFDMLHVVFAVMAGVSFACLVIDQVPKLRGTMFIA